MNNELKREWQCLAGGGHSLAFWHCVSMLTKQEVVTFILPHHHPPPKDKNKASSQPSYINSKIF